MSDTVSDKVKTGSLNNDRSANSVVIFHPGHVLVCYNTAFALQQAGMLSRFETGFYFKRVGLLELIFGKLPGNTPKVIYRQLMRRHHDGLSIKKIKTHSLIEYLYLLTVRLVYLNRFSYYAMRLRNRLLAKRVGLNALKSNPEILIGYDSCSLEAFVAVKESRIVCVLEQVVGSWSAGKKILDFERKHNPDFASTIP